MDPNSPPSSPGGRRLGALSLPSLKHTPQTQSTLFSTQLSKRATRWPFHPVTPPRLLEWPWLPWTREPPSPLPSQPSVDAFLLLRLPTLALLIPSLLQSSMPQTQASQLPREGNSSTSAEGSFQEMWI